MRFMLLAVMLCGCGEELTVRPGPNTVDPIREESECQLESTGYARNTTVNDALDTTNREMRRKRSECLIRKYGWIQTNQ